MVKTGEDWHGLQTTKLKNWGQTFQTIQPWLCSFNKKWHCGPEKFQEQSRNRPHYIYVVVQFCPRLIQILLNSIQYNYIQYSIKLHTVNKLPIHQNKRNWTIKHKFILKQLVSKNEHWSLITQCLEPSLLCAWV